MSDSMSRDHFQQLQQQQQRCKQRRMPVQSAAGVVNRASGLSCDFTTIVTATAVAHLFAGVATPVLAIAAIYAEASLAQLAPVLGACAFVYLLAGLNSLVYGHRRRTSIALCLLTGFIGVCQILVGTGAFGQDAIAHPAASTGGRWTRDNACGPIDAMVVAIGIVEMCNSVAYFHMCPVEVADRPDDEKTKRSASDYEIIEGGNYARREW